MKKLNQEIETLYNQRLLKEQIEIHLKNVQKKLRERYKELKALGLVLEKDENDVAILEKLSMRALFAKVLGNKEQQLERRRQNYLLSFLKYHDCEKRVTAKKYEIEILLEKLASIGDIEEKLRALIDKKRSQLKFRNKTAAKKIMDVEEKIRAILYQKKEIQEAISSGTAALPPIKKMYDDLLEMKSWIKVSDVGGLQLVSFYDQKRFAKRKTSDLSTVNQALDTFVDELDDLNTKYELDYATFIKRLSVFLEQLYDGLISDWIFHKKLKVSINITLEAMDKVKRIIEMLRKDLEVAEAMEQKEKEILQNLIVVLDIK